ncbi:DUF2161 family putative PD-(D/E)XK-type phosphodiesterase [Spirochaeta africana]|uniref:Uncharacterized protein n=1 Tax=Spirochaeta africana (strain ATCC 700263 / DSM 8902 / Z-7692) TaxID=889378 RepID=H9UII5_SPIAZ|nr:DUF2161 family putative PD-(D/E)XK-type phosphodiesterase [Spirochaeta africana]AFG37328.1 hypothetical protein Spiaf_1253 [Spirochaeta africana DSM 8902]
MTALHSLRETELYPPVQEYLCSLGYQVVGEAAGCDIAAWHGNELVAIELKSAINLKLILQAVERQESCDSVYLAVPVVGSGYPANYRAKLRLIKRLELGLLLVRFLQHRTRVELVCHPAARESRRNNPRRRAILREIHGRSGDHTPGGTRGKVVTAYREEALYLAWLLQDSQGMSPAECRQRGGSPKAAAILRDNHYGWFERIRRGVYRLHPAGTAALQEYQQVIASWDTPEQQPLPP